jgi:hypothetical protein
MLTLWVLHEKLAVTLVYLVSICLKTKENHSPKQDLNIELIPSRKHTAFVLERHSAECHGEKIILTII